MSFPDFISVYGINGFLRIFWRALKGALPPPKLKPHVLVTRFQKNVTQHKVKVKELEAVARIKDPLICLFKTKVQHAVALAEAMGKIDEAPTLNQKHPTFIQRYGGEVTEVLNQLVEEVKGVLHAN